MKCDLGCQVDGYIAVAAHTFIVPTVTSSNDEIPTVTPNPLEVITGPQADCMNAAYIGAEVASRLIRPGNTNKQVAAAVEEVGAAYGVQPIVGTVMNQMKRYVIDASKVRTTRSCPDLIPHTVLCLLCFALNSA